jgi:hypothetical protein
LITGGISLRLQHSPTISHPSPLRRLGSFDRLEVELLALNFQLQLEDGICSAHPLAFLLGHYRTRQVELGHEGGDFLWIPYLFQPLLPTFLESAVAFDLGFELVPSSPTFGERVTGSLQTLAGTLQRVIQLSGLLP